MKITCSGLSFALEDEQNPQIRVEKFHYWISLHDDLLIPGRHLDIVGADKPTVDSDESLNIAGATARLLTTLSDIEIARPPSLSPGAGELSVVDLGAEP